MSSSIVIRWQFGVGNRLLWMLLLDYIHWLSSLVMESKLSSFYYSLLLVTPSIRLGIYFYDIGLTRLGFKFTKELRAQFIWSSHLVYRFTLYITTYILLCCTIHFPFWRHRIWSFLSVGIGPSMHNKPNISLISFWGFQLESTNFFSFRCLCVWIEYE